MISLIICSRNTSLSSDLIINIQKTIGIEYEIILIDNSKNNYSIFSAYNEGVKRAKYQYLCFMHEDILYHTDDWGKKVIEHLKNESVGIIGIGGSHYFSKYPVISYWNYEIERNKFYSFRILQGYLDKKVYKTKLDCNWSCNEPIYGVSLDGVWFCIRKSLFDNSTYALKFDENTYQGFHLYDLDICMQINKLNYHIQIITDILIEHFSIGSFNEEWIKNSFIFSNKWKDQLPLSNGLNLQKEEINEIEYNKLISYIHDSVDTNKSLQLQLESIRQSKSYRFGKFLLKPIKWIKQ